MIVQSYGNIFQCDAEALVNPVNCVGVMGKGLALQFKNNYPENFRAYKVACEHRTVRLGHMFVFETYKTEGTRYIINFPTKNYWRKKSYLPYIESGLIDLAKVIQNKNIRSIAIPALGTGLGELNWQKVRPLIVEAMEKLPDVHVLIFEPYYNDSATR